MDFFYAPFTRSDYLRANKKISPATPSRDLKEAVETGLLKNRVIKELLYIGLFDAPYKVSLHSRS
jgi:hypothetical protein